MTDDEDHDEHEPQIFVNYRTEVKIIRLIESAFIPSWIEIRAEVHPNEDAESEDLDLAFAKIRYWYEEIVSRSISTCYINEEGLTMLVDPATGRNRSANILMLTPDEPSDEHLAVLFQSKMNALSNGAVMFGPTEIRSDNTMGLAFTFFGEGQQVLPTLQDWMGERNWFDRPWWERDDGSMIDLMPPEDADLSVIPSWAMNLDHVGRPKAASGAVVLRPDFRPTIIDGGKKP